MTICNDPTRRGQLAAPMRIFGEYSRYAVAPVHTRFDAVEWFDGMLSPMTHTALTRPLSAKPQQRQRQSRGSNRAPPNI
jgi:hypothetical protein